jgi:peroxiredoxin
MTNVLMAMFGTESGKTTMAVNVGDEAPNFTLSKQDGTQDHLKDLLQKSAVVLYFYWRSLLRDR